MQHKIIRMLLGVLLVVLVACTTPTPTPTLITRNQNWKPEIKAFGAVEMVRVPAGCFQMGNEAGRRDERPVNQVCFYKAFWIDRYEVTNAQYGSDGHSPGPKHPRENLTWTEARDFCKARDARLPNEAEWEYAARGPDNLIYPWGNTLIEGNLNFDRVSLDTVDVGSYPGGISWIGAFDLSGNVWEWVNSQYRPYPYSAADGREDENDLTVKRVYRGGWMSYIDFAAGATMRFPALPDKRDWRIGFRCARSE